MNDITAIILTKNEEKNIARCIKSITGLAERIIVVDSGSSDATCSISKELGAEVYYHVSFENHGNQFTWALDSIAINSTWIYRIDADEVVTPDLAVEIVDECRKHKEDNVNAFEMRFKVYFLSKFLKHGGAYPFCKINIFKRGKARFNERPLGDNVELSEGTYKQLKNDCLQYDFKDISSYVKKHDWYSDLEVESYFKNFDAQDSNLSKAAVRRKKIRNGVYYKLPSFLRAKLYYWYIYYLRLGFLDGKARYVHAFLQAYWYRVLVDAKIMERELNNNKKPVGEGRIAFICPMSGFSMAA